MALCLGLRVSPVHAAQPPVTALAFAPGGKSVAVGSQAGVSIYGWPGLKLEREVAASVANVNDLAFSPDGKSLAIAGGAPGEAGIVELVAWPGGESLRVLAGHEDCVQSVSWRDDATLASAGLDRDVVVWDAGSGELKGRLKGHSRGASAVCYIPGHPLLVSGSIDQTLRVWNIESGQIVRTLNNHTKEVLQLALRPAAEGLPLLASIGEDRTMRLWQPTIGRLVRFAELGSVPLAVGWLNDGSRVVISAADGHLRLIDPATAEVTEDLPAVDGWAYSLAVHPTDGSVLVGGRSGQLKRVVLDAPKSAQSAAAPHTPPLCKGGQGGSAHPGLRFAPETVWPAASLWGQGGSADRRDRFALSDRPETSNIEHRTSNVEFLHSMFNVERSMFDVHLADWTLDVERSTLKVPLDGTRPPAPPCKGREWALVNNQVVSQFSFGSHPFL